MFDHTFGDDLSPALSHLAPLAPMLVRDKLRRIVSTCLACRLAWPYSDSPRSFFDSTFAEREHIVDALKCGNRPLPAIRLRLGHNTLKLFQKPSVIVKPTFVVSAYRIVDNDDIGKYAQAKAALESTISKIEIVEMETVKDFVIKLKRLNHDSSHGDEHAIQRLYPLNQRRWRSIHINSIMILARYYDLPEYMPKSSCPPTGILPALKAITGINQQIGSSHPYHITMFQMPQKALAKIRSPDFNIVMRKYQIITPATDNTTVVALAQ
ncbi:MAG TPA: hypothetical protein P5260_16595 [Candidatus Competibacter sp.]|nr:hypothetical protein [Candidatus Competibacter sp.]HRX62813.1 hypothetical protein [Candidatus Competibacter sp.]